MLVVPLRGPTIKNHSTWGYGPSFVGIGQIIIHLNNYLFSHLVVTLSLSSISLLVVLPGVDSRKLRYSQHYTGVSSAC